MAQLRRPTARRFLSYAALAVAVAFGSAHARDQVEQDPRYRLQRRDLDRLACPPGHAVQIHADLKAALPGDGAELISTYAPDAAMTLARAWSRLPWVKAVREVRLDFPARLSISMETRRPAVGLRHGGGVYLLDADGVVLPAAAYEPNDPSALRLPVLEGARLPAGDLLAGGRIDAAPVRHGLSVARALNSATFQSLFDHAVAIDLRNVEGREDPRRSEIVVRSGRTVIEWGRAPVTRRMAVPTEQKLARLSLVIRRGGLKKPARVCLYYDDLEWQPAGFVAAPDDE